MIIIVLPAFILAADVNVDISFYKKVTKNSWYINKFNSNIAALDALIKDISLVSDSTLLKQMYYWKIDNYFAGKISVYSGTGDYICQYRNLGSSLNKLTLTEQAKIDILKGTRIEKRSKIVSGIGGTAIATGIVLGIVRLCLLISDWENESYPILTTSCFSLIFASCPIIITGFVIGRSGSKKISNTIYLHNGRLISEKY